MSSTAANITINSYALVDSGSAVTVISPEVVEQLQIAGTPNPLVIQWTDQTRRTIQDSVTVALQIGARPTDQLMHSIVARTMTMHLPTQSITIQELRQRKLLHLPIATYEHARPQVLLGLDNVTVTAPMQTRRYGSLVVHQTPIGWTMEGNLGHTSEDGEPDKVQCTSLAQIHSMVGRFIENETLGIDPKRPLLESPEIARAKEQLQKGTRQTESGYEVGLLWKSDRRPGPCNRQYAASRLERFEQKMSRDPETRMAAEKTIREYRERGYITKVPATQSEDAWYLPVFAVRGAQKIRLVWDAAAKFRGTSLNDQLLQGPDMNEPLWNILHRFREHLVAFCADVSEMFHRIRVPQEDRRYQRFLWRNQKTGIIEDFEMDVQTFGATCSPAIAQHVKDENARRFQGRFPKAVEAITRNTYVDDLLQSCVSEEEAVNLASQVTEIHREANFKLHKWSSNCTSIHDKFISTNAAEKEIQRNPKTLGLKWNTSTDEFSFDLNKIATEETWTSVPTKKRILSLVMSLFDPLGLIAPQAVVGRLILRDTWETGCEWGETVPPEIEQPWTAWVQKLKSLQQLRVPRWCGITGGRQLHIFVDASEKAMAAVAYLRSDIQEGAIVSLAAAKCKLAPTAQQSIPRLELQAAVLGLRLAEMIRESTSVTLARVTFWTDAQNTLWWLNSSKRKYRQYVALRVAEILSLSKVSDWRWVPGTQNPADIATKPHDWDTPQKQDMWLNGPNFLKQPQIEWPETIIAQPTMNEEALKVLRITVIQPEHGAVADPTRVSSWLRMVRVTAYAQRFLNGARMKRENRTTCDRWLSKAELELAEFELYREAQRTFSDEMELVKAGKEDDIPRNSELYGVDLLIDKEGILRFRSRNANATTLHYDARHPIVLPRHHKITHRIVESYHQAHLHENTQTVLNELRQRFFIRKNRTMINTIVRQCQKCVVDRARPQFPQMSNHPSDRLSIGKRAFHATGVDYFGPIHTTVGRRKEKRWGVLFTCLTTRAVHMEMAHTLSGESCKRCIENFIGRRGTPAVMRSDNGTNFVWAARNVRDTLGELLCWKFIPPGAPMQGGAWERLVGSIKRALSQMEMPTTVTDEQLQNFFIKAERLINTRPLTEIPVHHAEPALTPNHFLLGSSTGRHDRSTKGDETTLTYEQLLGDQEEQSRLLRHFWDRWSKEYLPLIAARRKWRRWTEPLEVDDLVFICDEDGWMRGAIKETMVDPECNQVREVIVRTAGRDYRRPATKVAKIRILQDDQPTLKRRCSGPITRAQTRRKVDN